MTEKESAKSSSPSSNEISAETSNRVCAHMNEDHAVSVYAMAKRKLTWPPGGSKKWKITDAILKSVSLEGCQIQVVMCSGDLCQVQLFTYPFDPPLKDGAELRPRMVAIHQEVCRPSWKAIWGQPMAIIIVVVYAMFGYCTLVYGIDDLTESIENSTSLNSLISSIFTSTHVFTGLVRFGFYATSVAHAVETLYAVYQSRKLKFSASTTFAWALQIAASGLCATSQFLELLRVDRKSKEAKKEKSG